MGNFFDSTIPLSEICSLNDYGVVDCHNDAGECTLQVPRPCHFNAYTSQMYIYSSLVKNSQVGNVYAPIMRVVAVDENQKSEAVCKTFLDIHYMHLQSTMINSIEIRIVMVLGMMLTSCKETVLCITLRKHKVAQRQGRG